MKRILIVSLLCLLVAGLFIGCAADINAADHHAAIMTGLANKLEASQPQDLSFNALDVVWIVENERRAATNMSDKMHWRKPTYVHPATRPTTMPCVPVDDVAKGVQ